MANLLDVEGLRTHIRMRHSTVEAVDGVSLTIRQGETVGLVGESGCGKSITGLSIMRLLPPGGRIVGGSIKLAGQEITALAEPEMARLRGNDVAMIFQDPMTSLDPTMTIGDQIAEPVRAHRAVSKKEALERAAEVLNLVGMPKPLERLKAFPHQLSGGLRQRAMIAMALACEPKLIIADEPTTALDVTIQAQILALLDDLKERLGMGMLLITHDMGVIAGRASRVMVMYAGRIVETADAETLFGDMRHPYTEALLDSIPDVKTGRKEVLYSIPGLPPDLSNPPGLPLLATLPLCAGPLPGRGPAARRRSRAQVCVLLPGRSHAPGVRHSRADRNSQRRGTWAGWCCRDQGAAADRRSRGEGIPHHQGRPAAPHWLC